MLYPLNIFVKDEISVDLATPTYWYEGMCPKQQRLLRLPRTAQAEAVAQGLMAQLAADQQYSREGKMYGVLLVRSATGVGVLKAFSGLLNGCRELEGWVPPIPGRDRISMAETQTLAQLDAIKQELIQLSQLPVRQQLEQQTADFAEQLRSQAAEHRDRKQQRHQLRLQFQAELCGDTLVSALAELDRQSQQDGMARRRLKQQRDQVLQPLQKQVNQADEKMRQLKQQRKQISRQLQTQMHAAYQLTNFAGESASLDQLMPALPTGTGDCCAPKLLHYAATHGLEPLAMAEFWWDGTFKHDPNQDANRNGVAAIDADNSEKHSGCFYEACTDRCQPIMGFLLSGLSHFADAVVDPHPKSLSLGERDFEVPVLLLDIIYEDADLIAVNKPAGLLSVPGRYFHSQDSVLSRLRCQYHSGEHDDDQLSAVHRLDQDTSGILLIARHAAAARHLRQQFQQRQVHKRYVAILAGQIWAQAGLIELPLRADPTDRPRQVVDWQHGKPCVTKFQVLSSAQTAEGYCTEVEFFPITGRTHQLRVHAAAPEGLNAPILCDHIYGTQPIASSDRLYLHAQSVQVQHPRTGRWLHLQTSVPWPGLKSEARGVRIEAYSGHLELSSQSSALNPQALNSQHVSP